MHRYIALIWNMKIPERTDSAMLMAHRLRSIGRDWRCVLDGPGVLVFHAGARATSSHAYSLTNQAGVVLGKLFRRPLSDGTPQEAVVGESDTNRILDTQGRELITSYWGRYIAFLYDRRRNTHYVVRDPSSSFPCFTTSHNGVDVYFSHLADICRLELVQLSVNWRYVAAHLLYDFLRVRHTGLHEVSEVLAGECIEIREESKVTHLYWDPADLARSNVIEDPAEAAAALRQTAAACTATWASGYRKIIHELSGGLDSSIVLACLTEAPVRPDVVCVNVYIDRAEGDERRFARLAADRAGYQLIEQALRPEDTRIDRVLTLPRVARPYFYVVGGLGFDETYTRLAREHEADAFFSGQGGDHLFHQRRTTLVAADYVYRNGLRPGLWPVVHDTARITQESIWSVGRSALAHGLLRRSRAPYANLNRDATFLNREIMAALSDDEILHPWLKNQRGVPPAKLGHIADLIDFQSFYFPFGRAELADVVHPLFSQPLIELCLRIPTYVLTAGGEDRALARRAFARDVPSQIIARRTKGDVTSYYNRVLSRDIGFVRELLLDGNLAKQRLIDRSKLELHLSGKHVIRGDQIVQILVYVSVEAWLTSWTTARHQVAA